MTMGVQGFKTKKALKAAKGMPFWPHVIETSMFGPEYKHNGRNTVVNDPYGKRNWFATVTTVDGFIFKVE